MSKQTIRTSNESSKLQAKVAVWILLKRSFVSGFLKSYTDPLSSSFSSPNCLGEINKTRKKLMQVYFLPDIIHLLHQKN